MTEFKITNLDRHTDNGFVVTVHWTASKTDGDYSASTFSTITFTEQPDQTLIPYDALTETKVIEWVKESLGAEGIESLELALANKIADQKAPKQATGMPWAAV